MSSRENKEIEQLARVFHIARDAAKQSARLALTRSKLRPAPLLCVL
jgi:16S rRNA U1498 N3-methylase RsmE